MRLKAPIYIVTLFLLQFGPKSSFGQSSESIVVNFKATGNEPFWSLEIDFDKQMHFKSLSYPEEMITPVPSPDIAQDVPVKRYRAITDQGELIVSIMPDTCMDTMADEKFPFSVSVSVKLTGEKEYREFSGCGNYLMDQRLHNIWALQEMNNQSVVAETFTKGLPTLELNTSTGRVIGHDGCNQLFGNMEVAGDLIRFTTLASTQMFCPDMDQSIEFIKLLSEQQFSYSLEPRELILKQDEKVVLKFKNVD